MFGKYVQDMQIFVSLGPIQTPRYNGLGPQKPIMGQNIGPILSPEILGPSYSNRQRQSIYGWQNFKSIENFDHYGQLMF